MKDTLRKVVRFQSLKLNKTKRRKVISMALNINKSITNESKAFATGKVGTVLLKLAIPTIISLFVAELYNMVDTMFVGRTIGGTAIGALTIAFPIQRLIISIGLLIAVGAATAVARSLGEGNHEKLKYIITNALTLMFLGISLLTLLIYIFRKPLIGYLGATDNIYPYANEYISIVIFGGLFQCFTTVICYIMTSLGNAKANLIATTMGALCNIVLDYILVIIFSLGVKGAAIATVVSQIISAIYALRYFLKIKHKFNLSLSFSLNKEVTSSIITVGFSTFIVEISDAVVAVFLNNLLKSHGDLAIIIVGVISRVSMFMYITMLGITSSMQPIVAFNYGAKNFKRVKEVVKKSIIAVTTTSVILWAIMFIFSNGVIGSFVKEKDILVEAVKAFRIVISVFPCVGTYFVAIYYYQAIEEPKLSLLLSVYRQLLIFIPAVFMLVRMLGVTGTWIAYPVSDVISAFTGIYYMRKAIVAMDDRYREFEDLKALKGSFRKSLNNMREA